jgi:hypothetical protein
MATMVVEGVGGLLFTFGDYLGAYLLVRMHIETYPTTTLTFYCQT